MKIRRATFSGTRSCKYSLSLCDDSIFADFNIKNNGCLYLIRISFDGYGCHNIDSNLINEFSFDDSGCLIRAILSNDLENVKVETILKAYFRENKEFLWEGALREYELI